MKYYSTNKQASDASLEEAVVKGLASDKGLYMPYEIKPLPKSFFDEIENLSFQEIAYRVADAFFGEDVPAETLKHIVYDTLNFDVPAVKVKDNIYSLELFHGPTLAFKDVGGRFMARLLGYFIRKEGKKEVNVLVATSGDTGSAVANGFLGVEGIHVYVLYPKGKVSEIQEKQFTTLGKNITAIEVDGTFDDCQALVKNAFMDKELNAHMQLTSANSINVARFLPQSFYYFYAYAQMKKQGLADNLVVCVPSGNFGNITAGLFGKKMGLPIKRFIAANNRNDIFYQYLKTGEYNPRPSIATIANAMDVGDPSNFARIIDLYGGSHDKIAAEISGETYTDEQISETVQKVYEEKFEPVFPYLNKEEPVQYETVKYETDRPMHASYTVEKPHVLLPVFPGTNCEWDTAKAFERAGAETEIFVIRNRSAKDIAQSVEGFAKAIERSHIIAIPGGFSGGDEPDGSGKFITAFFRNPDVKAAVTRLLDEREGLMLGICNGFQALIKLGLVPYGKIIDTDEHCPTLTFNTIGRHQSMLVHTVVSSNKSPWMRYMHTGDVTSVAISHGEGRFVIEKELFDKLAANGQIASQYCDLEGVPTSDIRYNPNNSYQAVEGIFSPDGRIFGKMGHSERSGDGLYENIPDLKTQELIFKGAVDYFR